jgi:Sec-independent protein translocase protein TatA
VEILGVGPLELLFVIILALVLVGPQELGKTARSAGRLLNRVFRSEEWSAVQQASRNLRNLPARLAREAEIEELAKRREALDPMGSSPPDSPRGLPAPGALAWKRPTAEKPPETPPAPDS